MSNTWCQVKDAANEDRPPKPAKEIAENMKDVLRYTVIFKSKL